MNLEVSLSLQKMRIFPLIYFLIKNYSSTFDKSALKIFYSHLATNFYFISFPYFVP